MNDITLNINTRIDPILATRQPGYYTPSQTLSPFSDSSLSQWSQRSSPWDLKSSSWRQGLSSWTPRSMINPTAPVRPIPFTMQRTSNNAITLNNLRACAHPRSQLTLNSSSGGTATSTGVENHNPKPPPYESMEPSPGKKNRQESKAGKISRHEPRAESVVISMAKGDGSGAAGVVADEGKRTMDTEGGEEKEDEEFQNCVDAHPKHSSAFQQQMMDAVNALSVDEVVEKVNLGEFKSAQAKLRDMLGDREPEYHTFERVIQGRRYNAVVVVVDPGKQHFFAAIAHKKTKAMELAASKALSLGI